MRSVVRNFRIARSTVVAVAVAADAEIAVGGAAAVVAAVAVAAGVAGVAGSVYGWPSIYQRRLIVVSKHGSLVVNMVRLVPIDAILVADYFAAHSHIAEWAQSDSVYALVVADTAITIQQLMSLRNIQIHCLGGRRGEDHY